MTTKKEEKGSFYKNELINRNDDQFSFSKPNSNPHFNSISFDFNKINFDKDEYTQNQKRNNSYISIERKKTIYAPAPRIQPELKVSNPSDPYEQEADRVAEKIVNTPPPHSVSEFNKRNEVDNKIIDRNDRKCNNCHLEQKTRDEIDLDLKKYGQSFVSSVGGGFTDKNSKMINSVLRGPSKPLDQQTREYMEPRFGYDFGSVRIHTGTASEKSTEYLNALAFTYGKNIVFAKGRYQPNNADGLSLIAHELVHVVQQSITGTNFVQLKPKGKRIKDNVWITTKWSNDRETFKERVRHSISKGTGIPVADLTNEWKKIEAIFNLLEPRRLRNGEIVHIFVGPIGYRNEFLQPLDLRVGISDDRKVDPNKESTILEQQESVDDSDAGRLRAQVNNEVYVLDRLIAETDSQGFDGIQINYNRKEKQHTSTFL